LHVLQPIYTIFASIASASLCTSYAILIAFAVLLKAARLFTMTAFAMLASGLLNLRLESMGVSIHYGVHGILAIIVSLVVAAVGAVAIGTTA